MIHELQASKATINNYVVNIAGNIYRLYSLLDDLNPTQTGAYRVDLLTGTVTTADGTTLVGIFKGKVVDLHGYSSIGIAYAGDSREQKFELWEVI